MNFCHGNTENRPFPNKISMVNLANINENIVNIVDNKVLKIKGKIKI